MVARVTVTEGALLNCALMILNDQCPPDTQHYYCMKQEDDGVGDCVQCWQEYVWGIAAKTIKLPWKGE